MITRGGINGKRYARSGERDAHATGETGKVRHLAKGFDRPVLPESDQSLYSLLYGSHRS